MEKNGVVIIYKVLVAYLFALKMRGKCLARYKPQLPACMYVYVFVCVFVCVLECVAVYRVVECILNVQRPYRQCQC